MQGDIKKAHENDREHLGRSLEIFWMRKRFKIFPIYIGHIQPTLYMFNTVKKNTSQITIYIVHIAAIFESETIKNILRSPPSCRLLLTLTVCYQVDPKQH